MIRTCFATLIILCGLAVVAQAQVYTTWYGPTYSYAYSPVYSSYGYTASYAPVVTGDWRAERRAYRQTARAYRRAARATRRAAFYSAWYGSPTYATAYAPSYTVAYAPTYTAAYSPAYTVAYSPSYTAAYSTTSYYSPSGYAAYSPVLTSSNTCCMVPTTQCCGLGVACVGGDCPGGNCLMNYSPNDGMQPRPDPASSGSSGVRRFESESDPGAVDPADEGGFRRSNPNRPSDGYESGGYDNSGSRGAGFGPRQPIEQRNNGTELPKRPTDDLPDAEQDEFRVAPPDNGVPSNGLEQDLSPEEPAADLLNLDTRLTQTPALPLQRHSLRARFGSPQLARSAVDPATLSAPAEELRLVKK